MAAHLTKPVGRSELNKVIVQALGYDCQVRPQAEITPPAVDRYPGLHILLAEDNPVNQLLAVRVLEKRGHRVEVAVNGRDALDKLQLSDFDLVLMDVQMPDMDGFEATTTLREKEGTTGRHLPVIAMTAYALQGDRERCLAAGMDDYVGKPIDVKNLFESIERVMDEIGSRSTSKSSPR